MMTSSGLLITNKDKAYHDIKYINNIEYGRSTGFTRKKKEFFNIVIEANRFMEIFKEPFKKAIEFYHLLKKEAKALEFNNLVISIDIFKNYITDDNKDYWYNGEVNEMYDRAFDELMEGTPADERKEAQSHR